MNKKKSELDLTEIAQIEQAIAKKYGQETIINPKSLWDDEKEKEYLQELKKIYNNELKEENNEKKEDVGGFLIIKRLINKGNEERVCPVCQEYSFKIRDDVYMNKYQCCYKCYIKYVEGIGREQEWLLKLQNKEKSV